ncbi:MAG: GldG family protein [Acidobacteriia bacterium]|nr:GldG family protein [Terriglobia bacterium]
MTDPLVKRLSKPAGGLGLLLLALGAVLYSAHSVFDWAVWTAFGVGAALLIFHLVFHYRELLEGWRLRSTQYGANTLATVAVFLTILGLINFLGSRHHKRFDLTTSKLYSISEQTIKVLKNLDGDVRMIYFDQTESHPVRDLIREYQSQSPRIKYEFLDAEKYLAQARQYSVRSLPTIVILSGNNPDQKQLVTTPAEEDLTNAIVKLTHRRKRVIYFTEGHGEGSIATPGGTGFSGAKKGLEDQGYDVTTINLTQSKSVPRDCSVLVIAGPKYPLFQPEADEVAQYVEAGGKVLVLVDPETDPGLTRELEKWKIQVDNDAVVDASGIGQLLGMGPAAPIVTEYEKQPIVKDFARTMTIFPLARSVRVADTKSDFSATSLFRTSTNSWGESNLNEKPLKFDKGKDLEGPLSLAVVSTKPVLGSKDQPAQSKEARVEVIGNSRFASNEFFRLQRNGDLFLNSVSWLAEDEDLVSIRPRNADNRRVELSASTGQLLFWFIIIVLPASVLLAGAMVWARRRK